MDNKNTGSLTLDRGALGAHLGPSATGNYNGYIGEVVVYNRALTNTECGTVRTGLISKWAL